MEEIAKNPIFGGYF